MIYQMVAPERMVIAYYNQHMHYKFFIPFEIDGTRVYMETPEDVYYSKARKILEEIE